MSKSLKLVHCGEPQPKANPIETGGWHHNVDQPEEAFASLTYRFGFKRYVVLDINQYLHEGFAPELNYSNLDADMLAEVDANGGLGDCSLFQVLAQTCLPFSWKIGVNAFTGLVDTDKNIVQDNELDDLLEAFDIGGGFCVPVHAPNGRRYVVIFMGPQFDNSKRHDELVVETINLFDGVVRAQLRINQVSDAGLTSIEIACLSMLSAGFKQNNIASFLNISEHLVLNCLDLAAQKLGAKNTYNAIASSMGLIAITETNN